MKILIVNFPYFGHTIPTLDIAEELQKRGHEVGYINEERWRKEIERRGLKFIPYDYFSAGKEYGKIKELKITSNIHIFDKVPQLEVINNPLC